MMLNKKSRSENKSNGPWGMKNYNFTYRKTGDTVERHRFVQAPTEDGASKQFEYIMEKAGIAGWKLVSIEEVN